MQRRSLALLIAATFVLVVIAAVALGTGGHGGGHAEVDQRTLPGLAASSAMSHRSRFAAPAST